MSMTLLLAGLLAWVVATLVAGSISQALRVIAAVLFGVGVMLLVIGG